MNYKNRLKKYEREKKIEPKPPNINTSKNNKPKKIKMTKKEVDRLSELEEKALEKYLENSDFQPQDWLDKKEGEEWATLFEKFLQCQQ